VAPVVLEVLTSDFLKKKILHVKYIFLCFASYEDERFSAFFPGGGWMGGQKSLLLQQPRAVLPEQTGAWGLNKLRYFSQ